MEKSALINYSTKAIYAGIILVLIWAIIIALNNNSAQPSPAPELLNKAFQNCYSPTQPSLPIILLPLDAEKPTGYVCLQAAGPRTVITTTNPIAQSTVTQLKDIAEIESISGTRLKLTLLRSTISSYPGVVYGIYSFFSGRMLKVNNIYSNGYSETVYLKKGKSGLVGEASLIVPKSTKLKINSSEVKVNFDGLALPTGQVNVVLAKQILEKFGFAESMYEYYFFYVELQSKGYDTAHLGLPDPRDLSTLRRYALSPRSVDAYEIVNAAERIRNVRLRTKIQVSEIPAPQ